MNNNNNEKNLLQSSLFEPVCVENITVLKVQTLLFSTRPNRNGEGNQI